MNPICPFTLACKLAVSGKSQFWNLNRRMWAAELKAHGHQNTAAADRHSWGGAQGCGQERAQIWNDGARLGTPALCPRKRYGHRGRAWMAVTAKKTGPVT